MLLTFEQRQQIESNRTKALQKRKERDEKISQLAVAGNRLQLSSKRRSHGAAQHSVTARASSVTRRTMSAVVLPESVIRSILEWVPAETTTARLWYHEQVGNTFAGGDGDVCVVWKKNLAPMVTLCGWWKHSRCFADADAAFQNSFGSSGEAPSFVAEASRLVPHMRYFGTDPGDAELPMDLEGFWDRRSDGSWFFCCTAPLTNVVPVSSRDECRAFERRLWGLCASEDLPGGMGLVHNVEGGHLQPAFYPGDSDCDRLGEVESEPSVWKKSLHLSKDFAVDQTALVYARLCQFTRGFFSENDDYKDFANTADTLIDLPSYEQECYFFGTAILDVDPVISAPDDADVLENLTKARLETLCRDNGLPVEGNKSDLATRLLRGTPAPLSLVRQQHNIPAP